MTTIHEILSGQLQQLREQGLYRQRQIVNEHQNHGLINFCSNDYLSLSQDAAIRQAYQLGFEKYPSGSGGSALICGYHSIHRELERVIASALGVDDAMLFSSGYAANLGVVSALVRMEGHLVLDKGLHASFYDGIQINKATYRRFLHNDMLDLVHQLEQVESLPVIITEGIFSMSGQSAPLNKIMDISQAFQALCIVDEAHSFGVVGDHGLGAAHQCSLTQEQCPLRIISFGKAFASQGAVVVGQGEWIEALVQYARSHVYSTAMSPALAYGLLQTFQRLYDADDRRRKLKELVHYFRQSIQSSPLIWKDSDTPIQQLQLGCPHRAANYAALLEKTGIFCRAIRAPTVLKKYSGLRVVLNYQHTTQDIDYLFQQLHDIHDH